MGELDNAGLCERVVASAVTGSPQRDEQPVAGRVVRPTALIPLDAADKGRRSRDEPLLVAFSANLEIGAAVVANNGGHANAAQLPDPHPRVRKDG